MHLSKLPSWLRMSLTGRDWHRHGTVCVRLYPALCYALWILGVQTSGIKWPCIVFIYENNKNTEQKGVTRGFPGHPFSFCGFYLLIEDEQMSTDDVKTLK